MSEKPTQAEKLAIIRAERGFNTLHGRAIADAALEHQGRFRGVTQQTVVGSTASYPRMQSGPWSEGIDQLCGIEPPVDARDCGTTLGYEIDGPASSSLASEVGGAALTLDDGSIEGAALSKPEAAPSKPEVAAEHAAALADRMLQIKGLAEDKVSADASAGPVRRRI
jgi:hypothetical protein